MAKPKKNVVGEVYGRLTITGDAPYRTKDRRVYVQCECGNAKDVLLGDLRRGDTVSCGCYLKEVIMVHGDATTRLYKIFKGMHNRCCLPSTTRYVEYGGRGIRVCPEWHDYEVFRAWALTHGYEDTLSIDRKDNDKNYEPDNCRWIPKGHQQRNKRVIGASSQYVGVTKCKQTGRWLAMIKVDGKQKNLGRYDTEAEAAKARDNYIVVNALEHYIMNNIL
jgi:hypothetical protein